MMHAIVSIVPVLQWFSKLCRGQETVYVKETDMCFSVSVIGRDSFLSCCRNVCRWKWICVFGSERNLARGKWTESVG